MADSAVYRRPGGQRRTVRHLVFDRLPAAVQDRLVTSLAKGGAPQPLISEVSVRRPGSMRAWGAAAVVAALVDALAWFVGFGKRLEEPSLSPLALAIVHAAAIATMLFAGSHAWRLARVRRGVPYPAGRHVFELDLVEVDGADVRATSLESLRVMEARSREKGAQAIVLRFEDGHEVVLDGQVDAEELAASAMAAVRGARELVVTDDVTHLARIDPFLELRVADDWGSAATADGARGTSVLERAPLAAVGAACVVAGAIVGAVMVPVGERHLLAVDEARLEDGRSRHGEDRVEHLERYVRLGGRRAEEVRDELFDLQKHDTRAMSRYLERGGPRAAEAEKAILESEDPAARSSRGPTGPLSWTWACPG